MKKIINLKDLGLKIKNLKIKKKVVLCHGAFDLFHPGHLEHLEAAKKLGDILVVSITKDEFIKKSVNSPFYNENIRAKFLSNISLIDFVCLSESGSAIKTLGILKPNIYCKGEEYKKKDLLGNLSKEKIFCKKNKIKFKLIGKTKYSSNNLISKNFFKSGDKNLDSAIDKEINKKNININSEIDSLKKLKVLIIGEIIFDKYTYVSTQGTSPKSGIISSTIVDKEFMPGGTLATYKFIRQFTKNVSLLSAINSDILRLNKEIFDKNSKKNLIINKNFEKIIKERVVEFDNKKKTNLKKIITINHFNKIEYKKSNELKLLNFLKKNIKNFDLVIVQDFGHGLITEKIADYVEKKSKFLSLNVQTNSLNYGFNIINKKFKKADLFTLDKRELELYQGKVNLKHELVLRKIFKELKSKYAFLTCGDEFSLAISKDKSYKIKTLDTKVMDAMGAGDIFHGMSSLITYCQKNLFLSLLLSQISGSLAVKIIGNKDFPKIHQIKRTFELYSNSVKK